MTAQPERGQLSGGSFAGLLGAAVARPAITHLIVTDGLTERWLELGAGLLRLTSVGPRRGRGLIETVLEHPGLTPEAAARVQASTTAPRGPNGEDPVNEVLGGPELRPIADECRQVVVLDEFIDTIVWEGAQFELHARRPLHAPPADARREVVVLTSGVLEVVKQVRALADEWAQLCKTLGTPSRTWVRRSDARSTTELATLETVFLSLLPPEGCALDDVILGFRQSGPDALVACRNAVQLATVSKHVVLDLQPPPPSAARLASVAQGEVAHLAQVLPRLALPVHGLRRLARRQEEVGDVARALDAWCKAATLLVVDDRLDEAVAALREAIRVAPQAAFARERLATLLEGFAPGEEATDGWVAAAQSWADLGVGQAALRCLDRAAQLSPSRVDVSRRVLHVLTALGRHEEAAQAGEALVHRLESTGAASDVAACWEELARLAPTHPTARLRWRRAALRQRNVVAPLAAAALLAVGLASSAGWLHGRRGRLESMLAVAADVETLLRAVRLADARASVAALEGLSGDAPQTARSRALLDAVALDEGTALLANAAKLEAAGQMPEARKQYHRVETELRGTTFGEQATARLSALALEEQQAQRTADLVETLRGDLARLTEAFTRGRELALRFGWTEAARNIVLPIEVSTTRPGAKVLVDGQPVGVTPCVVARSTAPFALEVTQDGFQPRRITVDPLAADFSPRVKLDPLHRAVRWQLSTLGPLTAPPLVGVSGIVLAGGDQRVYGIARDGVLRWTVHLSAFGVVLGSPTALDDDVAVIIEAHPSGGRALALDVRTGAPRWSRDLALTEPRGVGALNGGTLVSSATGRLVLLDPTSGAPRWTVELGSPPVVPPTISDDRLVAVTEDGRVHLVDGQGKTEPLLASSRLVASPLAAPSRGWLFGTTDELTLAPAANASGWSRQLAHPLSAMPLILDGLALAACGGRLVALSLHDGAPRWERDLGSPLGQLGGRPGLVYVGAADGTVHAIQVSSGQTAWTFRADGAVTAAPIVQRGVVFVASEGGTLSAILEAN